MSRRHVLALLGALSSASLLAATQKAAEKTRVVRITAKKFEFLPREITLTAGQPVTLELTALDFVHGFNIPDLQMRTDIQPGSVTRLSFLPRQACTLDFLCDNFCGTGHEEMNGKFIVKD